MRARPTIRSPASSCALRASRARYTKHANPNLNPNPDSNPHPNPNPNLNPNQVSTTTASSAAISVRDCLCTKVSISKAVRE